MPRGFVMEKQTVLTVAMKSIAPVVKINLPVWMAYRAFQMNFAVIISVTVRITAMKRMIASVIHRMN